MADRIEIRWEVHGGGGSAWISQDGEWLCVWSTAPGNVGMTLPSVDDTDDMLSMPVIASISLPPVEIPLRRRSIAGLPIVPEG